MSAGKLRVGTSSWSSSDWVGPFYPPGTQPRDFLVHYASRYDTVECDATFYHVPRSGTVDNWRERTPDGFLFSAKLPRTITHEKGMVDCRGEVAGFLSVMERLGEKLGPLVAQFPYVAKKRDPEEYLTGRGFIERLAAFLDHWPAERTLAVEVRNAKWLDRPMLDLLRERRVALVLPSYYTMPGPDRLFRGPDPVTADLLYVRFLGDHRRMDDLVARLREEGGRKGDWDSIAVDREEEMGRWIEHLQPKVEAGATLLGYFNNHYAGFGPGSAARFLEMWAERGGESR